MKTNKPDSGFWSYAHPRIRRIASYYSCEALPFRSSVTRFKSCHSKQSFSSCTAAKLCFVSPRHSKHSFSSCARTKLRFVNPYSGFTLLEVMVALAIFAIAAVAVTKVGMPELCRYQGETWQIDKRSESTISPNVQRVEIQVSLFNNEQGKVESGITNIVFFNYPQQVKTQ